MSLEQTSPFNGNNYSIGQWCWREFFPHLAVAVLKNSARVLDGSMEAKLTVLHNRCNCRLMAKRGSSGLTPVSYGKLKKFVKLCIEALECCIWLLILLVVLFGVEHFRLWLTEMFLEVTLWNYFDIKGQFTNIRPYLRHFFLKSIVLHNYNCGSIGCFILSAEFI